MKTSKYIMHVVSHTHWDREWYLTFQQFRMKLVDLIDYLLNLLDTNPEFKYFTLDGQTVMLEDYLEIRPENKDRLKQYIKQGRILIGPWYVLADEFLVSAESLVRNLILGHKASNHFGQVMKIGYLPDQFGHISQMPQILRGFGIDNVILGRGIGDEIDETGSEFIWHSPDETDVLAIFLAAGSYGNAMALPTDVQKAYKRIKLLEKESIKYGNTCHFLLMNGCDHLFPQPDIPKIIRDVNKLLDNAQLMHSTLPEYIRRVREMKPRLKKYQGEFRSGRFSGIFSNVLSTRIHLKQENSETQTILEKWAEPFSAFAWTLGELYPTPHLWKAWKYLLQNHPHDDICGCSIDQVHEQMKTRFAWSQEIGKEITNKSLQTIATRIDTSDLEDNEWALVVFNPLSWPRTDLVNATIDIPSEIKVKDFIIKDTEGRTIPYHLSKHYPVEKLTWDPHVIAIRDNVERFEVTFLCEKVQPCGYMTYRIVLCKRKQMPTATLVMDRNTMENEYLKVTIKTNGGLFITDKKSGAFYDNCNYFSDSGDAGDEYTYSPPSRDRIVTTLKEKPRVSLIEDNPLYATFKIETNLLLPESLTLRRNRRSDKVVPCPVVSYVSVSSGVPRVDIVTILDNKAKDHRLRVLFPSGIKTDYSFAEGQYDVIKRPIKLPIVKGWEENPSPTYPQQSFVDISDDKRGLTIANQGLPEYEVKDDSERTIALTLLRSVGWLSRDDLLTRKGHAGVPSISTPEAQCIGRYYFNYSIIPHLGTWRSAKTYQQANQYNVPLKIVQTGKHTGELPKELTFITINPDNLIISAIKKAENNDSLIVRFYNILDEEVTAKIKAYKRIKRAKLVNLNEEINEKLKVTSEGTLNFPVGRKKVITVEILF